IAIRSEGEGDGFATVNVRVTSDSSNEKDLRNVRMTSDSSNEKDLGNVEDVVLRLDGGLAAQRVELTGPLDDVLKKLEAMIVELKKEADEKPESKERIEKLVKIQNTLKKVSSMPESLVFRSDARTGIVQTDHAPVVARLVQRSHATGEKADE